MISNHMPERNRENLGNGWAVFARRYNDRVLKTPYLPGLNSIETPSGKRMFERAGHDLEKISDYFGESLVEGSSVFTKMNRWFIELPYSTGEYLNFESPELAKLKPEVERIFECNDRMVAETGFTVDFFGGEFLPHVFNYLFSRSYWEMSSFKFKEKTEIPELRLIDTGLLWTRFEKHPENLFVLPYEPIAGWTTINHILPMVKKRMGIDSLASGS